MDILRALLKMKISGDRKPNFERFRRTLTSNDPGPVSIGDIFADTETMGCFLKAPMFDWVSAVEDPNYKPTLKDAWAGFKSVRNIVRFCELSAWDYAFSFSMIPFPGYTMQVNANTSVEVADGKRAWIDDNRGPIMSWDDFERYKWPKDPRVANIMTRTMAKCVPDGMKVMFIPGGIFEWLTWLMGLVPFSYALMDQPDLVDAVIKKVSDIIYDVVEDIIHDDNIGGVFMGDDMGYATGTMVSPSVLREKFLPHMKRVVDLVHSAGKIFVLHSCGNIYEIMEDLIEMGVDAKHSFEDKILPVDEAYRKWGDRIGLIGGVDMDIMASGTQDQVKRRAREILDTCAAKGRYVLGTGNSVANYVPLENYMALIDEAKKWNMENFGTPW